MRCIYFRSLTIKIVKSNGSESLPSIAKEVMNVISWQSRITANLKFARAFILA